MSSGSVLLTLEPASIFDSNHPIEDKLATVLKPQQQPFVSKHVKRPANASCITAQKKVKLTPSTGQSAGRQSAPRPVADIDADASINAEKEDEDEGGAGAHVDINADADPSTHVEHEDEIARDGEDEEMIQADAPEQMRPAAASADAHAALAQQVADSVLMSLRSSSGPVRAGLEAKLEVKVAEVSGQKIMQQLELESDRPETALCADQRFNRQSCADPDAAHGRHVCAENQRGTGPGEYLLVTMVVE